MSVWKIFAEFTHLTISVTFVFFYSFWKWLFCWKNKDISDDIVLITGGNKGIGKCIALELSKYKPKHIVIWGRDKPTLKDTTQKVINLNVPCTYMVCDVSDKELVYKKAKDIENTIGHVTILINNAGIVFGNDIINSNEDEMKQTFQVNVLGHFWTIKAFLPQMMNTNHGHIVSMSSVVGMLPLPGIADYVATKFAVTGLLETLTCELYLAKKNGVHTSSIHPYLVDTEMFAGCSIRFSWLFPPLKQTYVAKRTVQAILQNQNTVLMPRIMYLFYILKTILPVECMLIAQKFVGIDKAMDNFHGRKNKIRCS